MALNSRAPPRCEVLVPNATVNFGSHLHPPAICVWALRSLDYPTDRFATHGAETQLVLGRPVDDNSRCAAVQLWPEMDPWAGRWSSVAADEGAAAAALCESWTAYIFSALRGYIISFGVSWTEGYIFLQTVPQNGSRPRIPRQFVSLSSVLDSIALQGVKVSVYSIPLMQNIYHGGFVILCIARFY